jgi:putative ABC transport system permease protein
MPEIDPTNRGTAARAASRGTHAPKTHVAARLATLGRAASRLAQFDAFRLDIKLGLRVLVKFWGLTLFGGLAMAMAITLGASIFELLRVATGTAIPLDDGDRVVMIQPVDAQTQQTRRASVEDFERWRMDLRSVEDVGAFRTMERDLMTANGPAPPVPVAEMSAAGFDLARVAPLRGRFLLPEDERSGASPVLVIGYDAWQSTFGGNADVVGQTVQLDGVFHTVVGVMPEGFGFPLNHQYWMPLQANTVERVAVFARLAPGASLEMAQAEVESLGLLDPDAPADARLRPRLVPYVVGILGAMPAITALVPLILPLLLIPPCVNIAVLVYARTVSRQGELAARTALGATRGRIVGQIFVEVLILSGLAAGLALIATPKVVEFISEATTPGTRLPFWMNFGLSYTTIGYACALAVVAALIAGAIPALRATGRLTLACLHTLGSLAQPKLGKLWTTLVLLQVALSMAVLPIGSEIAWTLYGPTPAGLRFAPGEYLMANLSVDPQSSVDAVRFGEVRAALVRRLQAEPGVTGVTVANGLPSQESQIRVQAEVTGAVSATAFNRVDLEFFDTFNTRVLTGRGFDASDFEPESNTAVVNLSFARRVLGHGNPIGRRVRFVAAGADDGTPSTERYGPWLEVVGVVEDFSAEGGRRALYRPLPRIPEAVPVSSNVADSPAPPLKLAIHTGPTIPAALPGRLREIVALLDPNLRIDPIGTFDVLWESFWIEDGTIASVIAGLLLGIVSFAVAGVYTLMAFTVVQRRREIAIRSALGATPWRLTTGIFRRVLVPVIVGASLGGLAALFAEYYWSPLLFEFREGGRALPWSLPAAEVMLITIGFLVAAGPARRALNIQPVEDLRDV